MDLKCTIVRKKAHIPIGDISDTDWGNAEFDGKITQIRGKKGKIVIDGRLVGKVSLQESVLVIALTEQPEAESVKATYNSRRGNAGQTNHGTKRR